MLSPPSLSTRRGCSPMSTAPVDELDRINEAFAGNRLLATFTREARAFVEAEATVLDLKTGDVVLSPGRDVRHSVFPCGGTTISLLVDDAVGRSIEVASIGKEGAIGGIVSCGRTPAYSLAKVQVPGRALRLPLKALEAAKRRSAFISNLFCRYSDYLLAQVMQSVACNAYHSVGQRSARWLLTAQDRGGDRVEVTQEVLAGLLGVQRTTLNAVVRTMQDEGLIAIGRGSISVRDRAGLKRMSCSCYDAVESHFVQVIGATGTGGNSDCA